MADLEAVSDEQTQTPVDEPAETALKETEGDPPEGSDEQPDAEGKEAEEKAEKAEPAAPEPAVLVLDLNEEAAPPRADDPAAKTKWVRLRSEKREAERKAAELEAQLASLTAPAANKLGPRPTLADDDVGYDTGKFEQKLAGWIEQKRQADAALAEARAEQEQQAKAWQGELSRYQTKRAALPADLVDDAEAEVMRTLSKAQQSVLIEACEDAPTVAVALARNPKVLASLKAIKSPIKLAAEVARLEKTMTVKTKKPATKPERPIQGGAESNSSARADALLAAAQKSGNFTEYFAYINGKEKQKAK
jgi:hypothetical protein